jgi:hypothetical protein
MNVEGKMARGILLVLLVVLMGVGFSLVAHAGEATGKPQTQSEKSAPALEPQPEKKAMLDLKMSSEKTVAVELTNSVPVRGVQFIVSGVNITEVRATKRTTGFLTKFNEKNGAVIVISTSEERIAPGKGSIAEIVCDKPGSAKLSEVRMAGSNREPL